MATEKISLFDSFEEKFDLVDKKKSVKKNSSPKPQQESLQPKEKKKKAALIVKKYPAAKRTVVRKIITEDSTEIVPTTATVNDPSPVSSFQKLSDRIASNLYTPPREVTLAPPEPPPIPSKPPLTIGKTLRFLRKLRSWIASPFIDKMVNELNDRLQTFQKNYDDKFAQLSYNAYTTGVGFGGGSGTQVINQIAAEEKKYYNNGLSYIESKALVTLSENDILDNKLTTIKQVLNNSDEPIGISLNNIAPGSETNILQEGTVEIPFTTLSLPIGTILYSGDTGEITTQINTWSIGKTVNQALNGKIYFKVQKTFGLNNEEAEFLGLPQR